MNRLRERFQTLAIQVARVEERLGGLDRITDEKFVKFSTMMNAQAEKVALALDAADKAVNKAEASINERLGAMNEFRGALTDQTRLFIPRTEAEQRMVDLLSRLEAQRESVALADQRLDDRIKALEQSSSNIQGRFAVMGAVIAFVVVLVNVAVALLTG